MNPIPVWLDTTWPQVHHVAILDGGEGGPPLAEREVLARIDDPAGVDQMRSWTASGRFAGDICRCPGTLTLALHGGDGLVVGSASVHGDRVSWERSRFRNDLLVADAVGFVLFLATHGVSGASKALLRPMIDALDLDEGEGQFRPAGDSAALAAHRVPRALFDELLHVPGDRAGDIDPAAVQRMTVRLGADPTVAVRALLAWQGTATWPAEALSGDGKLARRLLAAREPDAIARVLPDLTDPAELMGALTLALHTPDDTTIMTAIGPALRDLLS